MSKRDRQELRYFFGKHGDPALMPVLEALLADAERLDWFDVDENNILRIRTGRNRIGVATGGFLASRVIFGPEVHAMDIREAIDLASGKINTKEEQEEAYRARSL